MALVAITGGTGFVGGHVIRALLDAGHSVKALIRTPSLGVLRNDNLEWIKGSLGSCDADLVKDADVLIHIAGLIKARKRDDYYAVNVRAAEALAMCAKQAGVGRIVLLSSMAAQMPEISDYAGSKAAGEAAVTRAFAGPVAIIRAPAVFGPGDVATKPFFDAIKRGILPVPGGRDWRTRRISLVYVKDLAKTITLHGMAGKYDGQTKSPASIADVTWPQFASMVNDAGLGPVRLIPIPLAFLYPVAAITSVTSRLWGMGHLTLGKLREFLYHDWHSDDLIVDATSPKEALHNTLNSYAASHHA